MKDFIAERADDYEGPDFGMHDTEIYDRDEDGDELVQEEAASTCGICEANEPKAALTGTQQAKGEG